MMASTRNDLQSAELDLLQAMYPEQVQWHEQRQELTYTSISGADLVLRLDNEYPEKSTPTLISAIGSNKEDFRDRMRTCLKHIAESSGEAVLDEVIQIFEDLVQSSVSNDKVTEDIVDQPTESFKTTIIWLHHLLNTNKRKLATTPESRISEIIGLSKPGYPGVLIYSGNAAAIDAHVAILKDQRWQAFQVRLDETVSQPWTFSHSSGVKEVESMSDITSALQVVSQKEAFLKAMHIK